jgi:spore germination protein GerM
VSDSLEQDRREGPSHRTQRLVIAAAVLVAAGLVMLATRFMAPRQNSRMAQELSVPPPPQNATVTLFFAAPDGSGLSAETRELSLPADPGDRLRVLVKELASGPTAGGARALPPGTALRAVYSLDNGETMCLDFTRDLKDASGGGSTGEYLALGSILETVRANLPSVKRVQILVEGRSVETLAGHYDISRPLDLDDWKAEAS